MKWDFYIDTTTETHHTYRVFDISKRIPTEGICPVLTDFAGSSFYPEDENALINLTDSIGLVWGLIRLKAPTVELKKWLNEKSIQIGRCETKASILRAVNAVQRHLKGN